MLKITPAAATLLATARESSGKPEDFGVRFSLSEAGTSGPGSARIRFDFVPNAEPQDEVAEESGLRVYVAPEVSAVVGDATLEAQKDDGSAQLVLRP
jgi:Fe-S cluster assembly iron-binding protein IscA